MLETLPSFLKSRAERHYRYLLEQILGMTPEEALCDRRPDWPSQRWGIGQDGSIAGIVFHVASWKQLTLPLFLPEGRIGTLADLDAGTTPGPDDWQGIAAWLKQVGAAWNAELALLPDIRLDESREWEGTRLSLARIVVHMVEHDLQHAAQIEYLRQRHRTEG